MPLNIIICGGGIGGLAAAGFLRERHTVTVLERGDLDFTRDDYGLSVVTNAFGLLQKAGIKLENLDSVVMTHLWLRTYDNEEMRTIPFDTRKELGGAPSVLTRRAKLQNELLRFATSSEFLGTAAEIVRNAHVARVDADEGKVWTIDGQMYQGDLIIGADGIGSTVRATVSERPSSSTDIKLHDLLIFITRVPLEMVQSDPTLDYLANPSHQAGLVNFHSPAASQSKKRLLMYHSSPNEVQVLGYTTEKDFRKTFESTKSTIIKDIPAARVIEEFSEEFSPNLLNLFKHSQIDAWRIRDIDTCERWYRGKAVLIGDGAHAVTPHAGQGCNITIEDAEALAYLLRDISQAPAPEDLEEILQKFVSLRQGRAKLVLQRSREMGNIQSEEERKLPPINPEKFSMLMHSYRGAEHALKSMDASTPV